MKVLVQWARATPSDWVVTDSALWPTLPSKPEPVGGEVIDDNPGWIYQICVQGMCFYGFDHYAVVHQPQGCDVAVWNDDPGDFAAAEFYGHVVSFAPYEPDARFGGAYNTKQTRTVYAARTAAPRYADWPSVQAWNKFPKPLANLTRHGIWLPNELRDQTFARARKPSWREWSDGVPLTELDSSGLVKPPGQR